MYAALYNYKPITYLKLVKKKLSQGLLVQGCHGC